MHEFVSYIRLKRKENEEKGKKRRREGRKEVAKEGGRKGKRKEKRESKTRGGWEGNTGGDMETIYFRNASLPLKPATRASIKTCHCVKNPVNQSACWLGVPGNSYS